METTETTESEHKAPAYLSRAARRLWASVHERYQLEPHDNAILVKALEAFDRADEARAILRESGIVVTSRLGEIKAHPAVAIERDSRTAFLAGMRQLGLDYEPTPSQKRTEAARDARWAA